MAQICDAITARWVRFSRYEVRQGIIRPAQDAVMEEYDPWAFLGDHREPPYESLLSLLHGLKLRAATLDDYGAARPAVLDPASEKRLTAWGKDHGLLGVMLQNTQRVTFAPHWAPLNWTWPSPMPGKGINWRDMAAGLYPVQREYMRQSGTWVVVEHHESSSFTTSGPRSGDIVEAEDGSPWLPQAGTLWRERITDDWHDARLTDTWWRFFPDVPDDETETHLYPHPNEPRFWKCYGEPVMDFIRAAASLHDALSGLGRLRGSRTGADAEPTAADKDAIADGRARLNALVEGVAPVLVIDDDGTLRPRWEAPSLLASLAMMALQNLTAGWRVLTCETCHAPFTSDAYQARYCSERCRDTAQQRRYRQRKREGNG